jgi:acyl-CoA thioesterase-2
MATITPTITDFMQLERIEENIFRGESQDLGTSRVFGGQVLGQALNAAQQTIEDRPAHSVHAYFLRAGDFDAPIVYEVDRSRDGGSFSARRVVAIQHGRPIFTLSASFQLPQPGLEYFSEFTPPPLPDDSPNVLEIMEKVSPAEIDSAQPRPAQNFELYRIKKSHNSSSQGIQLWLKTREKLPDNANIHRTILAYISDYGLLPSALVPHGFSSSTPEKWRNATLASIDHAIWFHRPCRMDEWLFYDCRPISTSGSRGTSHGSFYTADGVLVATTFQEGLMRTNSE